MDVEERLERLTNETIALRKEMLIMKALIRQQTGMIRDLIEINHQTLKEANARPNRSHNIFFPLKSQEELDEFEKTINDSNRDQFISTIQQILNGGTLSKRLTSIITPELLMSLNFDGRAGKISFQEFKAFNDILFECLQKEGYSKSDYISDFRQALKLIKTRVFKARSLQKRAEKQKNFS